MMLRMGFDPRWVQWMLMCINSVSYSIIVNQDCVGPIHPGRGLRPGDPLSPYLFIIVAKGLTGLINQAVARGDIHGMKICKRAPILTHLLFVDDCFLFFRAIDREVLAMKNILEVYARASGQSINLAKSEVTFSVNVINEDRSRLANVMGVRIALGSGKYLGLPSMVSRSKKITFSFVKERV